MAAGECIRCDEYHPDLSEGLCPACEDELELIDEQIVEARRFKIPCPQHHGQHRLYLYAVWFTVPVRIEEITREAPQRDAHLRVWAADSIDALKAIGDGYGAPEHAVTVCPLREYQALVEAA